MGQIYTQSSKLTKLTAFVRLTSGLILLSFFTGSLTAQVSTLKLSTTNSSSYFDITDNSSNLLFRMRGDGLLGINQGTPLAGLHLVSNEGLLLQGTYASGTVLNLAGGTRMHWYPKKAAFRVGYVNSTQWDDGNIGNYSFASGYNTTAGGVYSIAMGHNTNASGSYSIAMGYYTFASGSKSTAIGTSIIASGDYSTAMGISTIASGLRSTAMGESTTASGDYSTSVGNFTTAGGNSSTAMGKNTIASGDHSTAMGNFTTASGNSSTAMGKNTTASGNSSTAMGSYVSTNSFTGSFIIGDSSTSTVTNSSDLNQMTMRFANGYKFYTKSDLSVGVQLIANATAWSTISDSTKKENFLSADGEYFLNCISKLRLGSWNYKGQDPKIYRHYGPMAQDIHRYFGNDKYGTIGIDTLINTLDMDGIEMIALQSLVKRTNKLKESADELKIAQKRIKVLENKVAFQQEELASQKSVIKQILDEFRIVQSDLKQLKIKSKINYSNMVLLKQEEK